MHVFIERENQNRQINFSGTAGELLDSLNINKQAVMVTRNDELIAEDEILNDKDSVKILSVISGG